VGALLWGPLLRDPRLRRRSWRYSGSPMSSALSRPNALTSSSRLASSDSSGHVKKQVDVPKRRLRADAARNRIAILEAAEDVFVEKGRALSTEAVAERAGVGIGTVFRHFPTKEALLQALLVVRLQQLAAEADALAIDDRGGALFIVFERLVTALRAMVNRMLLARLSAGSIG
jgi:hypothetical protein